MEESNESNIGGAVCNVCGLPIARPGTVTAWIFQTSYCSCQKGKAQVQAAVAAPIYQDASNQPVLGNRYRVLEPVGRGGVARVYKVQDSVTMRILAAKVMLTELALNDLAVKRFQKEVDVLAGISHENLVKIHGYAMDRNGVPYLIMDFVDGRNLEELIKITGPMDVPQAVNVFLQICTALKCVHDIGIIHRDLKPSNVIVSRASNSREDHVTVIDFGFAKIVDAAQDSRLTSTGEVFGSPSYMSPEHCLGQELDARSDIYSFGCLMYQVLCGHPPIEGENVLATVAKQVKNEVVSLRNVNPEVPRNLDTVIMQCLEKEPSRRYQTVDDIEVDLFRVLSGKHVLSQTREKNTEGRLWSPNSHVLLNRWVAMSAIILLVLGSGLVGAWIASNSVTRTARVDTVPQSTKLQTPPTITPTTTTPSIASPPGPPHIKTPITETPRFKNSVPTKLPSIKPTSTAKVSQKRSQGRTAPGAKPDKKQTDAERARWLRWLELKKLRKFN